MALGGGVMAKFTFKGLNEYARRLSKLGDQAERVAGKAIYAAAALPKRPRTGCWIRLESPRWKRTRKVYSM